MFCHCGSPNKYKRLDEYTNHVVSSVNDELKHIMGYLNSMVSLKRLLFCSLRCNGELFLHIDSLYTPHRWRSKWIYWPWGTQKMLTKADTHFKRGGSWESFPLLRHWQFNEFSVLSYLLVEHSSSPPKSIHLKLDFIFIHMFDLKTSTYCDHPYMMAWGFCFRHQRWVHQSFRPLSIQL